MGVKHWIVGGIILILATAVKAHMIFIRLVILATAGLIGLYLLHIIATDYRKIQAARPKYLGLFKRSVESVQGMDMDSRLSGAQKQLEEINSTPFVDTNSLSLIGAAAHLDPYGCARRYVCSVAARPPKTLSAIERTVLDLIENASEDAAPLQNALRLGRTFGDVKSCASRFPRCTYSVTEMLRLIQPVY